MPDAKDQEAAVPREASYSRYQKAAINHVCRVFSRQNAYLVADEVGLGKTFVAKGVIRALHQRLLAQYGRETMRVIYIASNQIIARTNARDLGDLVTRVPCGSAGGQLSYDRLSALGGGDVHLPPSPQIQVYAFSPNTTFTGRGSRFGNAEERRRMADQAPEAFGQAAEALRAYTPEGGRTQSTAEAVAKLRGVFNDMAVEKINPDLIILDEFHRFHTILSPEERSGEYSFHRMLHRLNRKRGAEKLPEVKILLLSATPYRYDPDADEPVHTYQAEERQTGDKDPTTAFEDFETLKAYICRLNGVPASAVAPEAYFDRLLCRTQRDWLCPNSGDEAVRDLTARMRDGRLTLEGQEEALRRHLAYSVKLMARLPAGENGADRASAGFETLRAYLDEAPEFQQFSDGYRSIQGSLQTPGGSAGQRALRLREAYCARLEENGQYLLRKAPGQSAPDWDAFDLLEGHYKWEHLKASVLPAGCEYRLWAAPIRWQREPEYAKTMVFAHYRVSTRAIAVLTSMEIEKRLHMATEGRLLEHVAVDGQQKLLLGPFRELLERCSWEDETAEKQLARAVEAFFNTTHARRVLTAFALREGLGLEDSGAIVERYCGKYHWSAAIREYLACLSKFTAPAKIPPQRARELLEELCSVLGWEDRDFTRVLVLPDWTEGYPCSFGERYTPDYSDQSAHDDAEKSGRQNTARRLEHIRDRFQSPFYPFVLAASETAQEGVNLHNYCQTVVHWSVPSNLNSFVQEEGRVDRRGSWVLRNRMMYLIRKNADVNTQLSCKLRGPAWEDLFQEETAAGVCRPELEGGPVPPSHGGLFPLWYLPVPDGDAPRLRRLLLCMPLSREVREYERLLENRRAYSTFGVQALDTRKLCPCLVYMPLPLLHGTNQYALQLDASRRAALSRACDRAAAYFRGQDDVLRQLRDREDDPDLGQALSIWEQISRGSSNFEYGTLYLTFSREKAETYAASSYPCGERSFCFSRLFRALKPQLHSAPPDVQEAAELLLQALEESKGAEEVLLSYETVPRAKVLALENGNTDAERVKKAIEIALTNPELAQDVFRVDGSVFPTYTRVLKSGKKNV